MTLSREQLEDDSKTKYLKWFWIWERDLLALAREHPAWRAKAHELGFSDDAIDRVRNDRIRGWQRYWPFPDGGRHLKYMENPWYEPKGRVTDSSDEVGRPRHEREPGSPGPSSE